jgi:hypothetical protein
VTRLDDLYLSRQLWGANPLHCTAGTYLGAGAFHGAVIHHDVIPWTPTANAADVARHARRVQSIRPDLPGNTSGEPEWPYSFGIAEHTDPDKAWTVEGRGAGRSGAHTAGYNFTRYGIVIFGDRTNQPLTPGMIAAIRHLCWKLFGDRKVEVTLGHRDTVATGCPGDAVYAQLSALQPPFIPSVDGDDDMNQATFSAFLAHALGGTAKVGLDERVYVTLRDGNDYPVGSVLHYTHLEAQDAAIAARAGVQGSDVSVIELVDELGRRLSNG